MSNLALPICLNPSMQARHRRTRKLHTRRPLPTGNSNLEPSYCEAPLHHHKESFRFDNFRQILKTITQKTRTRWSDASVSAHLGVCCLTMLGRSLHQLVHIHCKVCETQPHLTSLTSIKSNYLEIKWDFSDLVCIFLVVNMIFFMKSHLDCSDGTQRAEVVRLQDNSWTEMQWPSCVEEGEVEWIKASLAHSCMKTLMKSDRGWSKLTLRSCSWPVVSLKRVAFRHLWFQWSLWTVFHYSFTSFFFTIMIQSQAPVVCEGDLLW